MIAEPLMTGAPRVERAVAGLEVAVSVRRLVLVAASLAYTVAFQMSYRDLVFPQQEAWGAGYRVLPVGVVALIYAACLVPSLWMPSRFERPSQLLFYIQYYFVLIPSAFMLFYCALPELSISDAVMLLLWMSAGLATIEACYLLPLAQVARARIQSQLFWTAAAGVAGGLFAYTVVVMRGNFHLAGLDQIYDVRAALGDIIAANGNRLVVYAQAWIANIALPLAFALGAFGRRFWLALVGLAGYIFIFGVSGQKAALLAVAYLPTFYILLRSQRGNTGARIAVAFTVLLLGAYAMRAWFPPLVSAAYVAVINFRTFTIQGMSLGQYYGFFQTHPLTHFSHLAGVSSFVRYPYSIDIPYTIGDYYYNTAVGANSGMWASDAIAGAGPWGIPLVSAVAGGVFWFLDSCARPFDPRFTALVVAYIGSSFANVSLGTTLVTGGLAMVCAIFLMLPESGRLSRSYMRVLVCSTPTKMA